MGEGEDEVENPHSIRHSGCVTIPFIHQE